MFLTQPNSCVPTLISEKSLATTPSSRDHLMVGFLVRAFYRVTAQENSLSTDETSKTAKRVSKSKLISTVISLIPRIRYSVDPY